MAAPVYILTCFYQTPMGNNWVGVLNHTATAAYARRADAEAAGEDFLKHGVSRMQPADGIARTGNLLRYCVTRADVVHPLDAQSDARCSHVWHETRYTAGIERYSQQCVRCGEVELAP